MNRTFLTALITAVLLTACASADDGRRTQPITGPAPSDSLPQMSTAAASEQPSGGESSVAGVTVPDVSSLISGDFDADSETYFAIKAERDALDIDIENLESSYRIGAISSQDFRVQKQALELQDDLLDQQEELLESSLDLAYLATNPTLPTGTLNELIAQYNTLDLREDELELSEDKLELQYRMGEITREDFISKQIEILRQDETLDREKELVERALKLMGWDD